MKSDMYSLGCIIYELFHLSKYYNDILFMKKINQELNIMQHPKYYQMVNIMKNQIYGHQDV